MRGRIAVFFVLNFMLVCIPVNVSVADHAPSWRLNGLDPDLWTDGPVEEDTPMNESYQGNAVLVIEVTYHTGILSSETTGSIVIELFEQWAPITTTNIIEHIESGLYDGVFFHRVVNDFVIQSGDPECKVIGTYPITSPQCGGGGTGETIPLEHNENLSHVDGAIGMARGADEDSADSQWYITDTEQHGLDPENRDDGGYAVFGIVRHGMTVVREIASTPTVTNPGSDQGIQNPGPDLLGRPIQEARIDSIRMLGVADPDGTIRFGVLVEETEPLFTGKMLTMSGIIVLTVILLLFARVDKPASLHQDTIVTYDAMLISDEDKPD
ncbi:MAG TPA: peptidylprolyl isomerase [Candidatus Poseidoniaceae archaeon]|nr:MAG TPA: peptidylprolyl isomerase [Candidatus Poseidoniales archaeon]HII44805.1 peptidylprolyl isomerase [Candidatus Poseidoniaceae archaeon]|tara:strand:- start:304 stop:1278 length:975 start_codon:yes stop_codon:yes gene_type:complete